MLNNAYDKDLDYNYLTQENNAKVALLSSETKGCSASNVLSTDRKVIWLTESSIPQHLVIDLGNLIKKPKSNFKYFGIYCWHAYSTNPKVIELQFSKDSPKGNLISFGKYEIALKPGTQFFEIKNNKLLDKRFKYMKVIIKEAHGGNRTYLNQVYLFDELSGAGTINASTMNSFKVTQNSNRKENFKVNASESLFDGEREEEKDEDDDLDVEEDLPLREPSASAIERSYLMKNLNHDIEDDIEGENTCNKNRYINFEMEEDVIENDESFTGIKNEASKNTNKIKDLNGTKDKEDNKRVKKIESILKSKGKENNGNKSFDTGSHELQENITGNVQNYLSSQESNNKNNKFTSASNKARTKSDNILYNKINNTNSNSNSNVTNQNTNKNYVKEKLNRTFTHETSTNINKNKNDLLALHIHSANSPMNEYQQLENQLKDMEEHLKSMEADIKIEDYKYNSHIHNPAFITRNHNNNYNTISATANSHTLNHSKSSGYINTPLHMNNFNFNNANKDTGFNFGVSSGTNVTNPFISKKEDNQNDLLNNYLELDNDNLDRENTNNIFNINNKDNVQSNTVHSSSLEIKIQNIENKLGKFEGELKEMKNSFNKLMDNINRLVETGMINSGSNHNYHGNNFAGIYNTIPQNMSKNQNSNTNFDSINVAALGLNTHNNNSVNNSNLYNHNNNDMINLILSECNKLINEKLMINSNTINGNTNSNISSAKKRDNFKNALHSQNPNESFEESKFKFFFNIYFRIKQEN